MRKPTFASCALPPMLPPAEPGPRSSDRLSHVVELTRLGDADWEKEMEALESIVQQWCRAVLNVFCRP